ncbi:quinolinate synthase [Candidatus Woesearchaeota archaeon CG10_big_fil_rev_8_21_14_0_10_34_8]|nr:MAG: quinolinate synthase [Candidatus Woesearchaeota archaeon CG10_big_fil_rev_8_21_14_0_10_34_8]
MAIKNKPLSTAALRIVLDKCVLGKDMEEELKKIELINKLKKQKNAVILAHYYMNDAIKLGIADYIGDSLDLSKVARDTTADMIIFCGVHFMAETAKILNSKKKVFLPNQAAGCSLAESITAEDVRKLRMLYPDAAIVTYINTSAAVKAETDVCVTSANAPKIVKALPNKRIVFIPDKYMAANLKKEVPEKEIIVWDGRCIVHEEFTKDMLNSYRKQIPGLKVLAHYECRKEVVEAADMHGGTSDMRKYIAENSAPAFLLATECGLSSTIKSENPEKEIMGPCMLCPYMRKITIENTLKILQTESPEITVPENIRIRAKKSIDRMFELMENPQERTPCMIESEEIKAMAEAAVGTEK